MDSVRSMDSVEGLRSRLRAFAAARDWEQYHTPKNLAMALNGEAGELIAELQWLDDDGAESALAEGRLKERLADEAADVLLYLVRLTDVCGIDLIEAAYAKIERNETRFPPTA
jgi:NTP pyrophosphatase (non-canonical NTP hydrolase)